MHHLTPPPCHPATFPQVQRTIGVSDYVRRDLALKNLIQPLAGEYGMHNSMPQRELQHGPAILVASMASAAPPAACLVYLAPCTAPPSCSCLSQLQCGPSACSCTTPLWAAMSCSCLSPCTPQHCTQPADTSLHCPGPAAVKTHRELFSDFFASLFGYPLEDLIASSPAPEAAQRMHAAMQRDILGGGGHASCEAQVGDGGGVACCLLA